MIHHSKPKPSSFTSQGLHHNWEPYDSHIYIIQMHMLISYSCGNDSTTPSMLEITHGPEGHDMVVGSQRCSDSIWLPSTWPSYARGRVGSQRYSDSIWLPSTWPNYLNIYRYIIWKRERVESQKCSDSIWLPSTWSTVYTCVINLRAYGRWANYLSLLSLM